MMYYRCAVICKWSTSTIESETKKRHRQRCYVKTTEQCNNQQNNVGDEDEDGDDLTNKHHEKERRRMIKEDDELTRAEREARWERERKKQFNRKRMEVKEQIHPRTN